jgi:glycosyltransferase involved in cell wall biosynthesis
MTFCDRDRINRIASDPELCRRMCEAARRRVEERYSWRSIAKQTYDLYLKLRARHDAGAH